MATGLIALLDDVAGIAKIAAASLDDAAGQAAKAGGKAAGVVIDDTAVAPSYVVGFAAERELPIVWKIAVGSLKNKLLFLLPAALALSLLAPWAITPLLMAGGAYLCFEGAEKLYEKLVPHPEGDGSSVGEVIADPHKLEAEKVAGAIRTDLILSAEIMAITLATVADASFVTRATVLAVVGIGITILVYGVVAVIVKADDMGMALARRSSAALAAFGRGLVKAMPAILAGLGAVGTAAMIWVGGGIVLHGMEEYHLTGLPGWVHHTAVAAGEGSPVAHGFVEWAVGAAFAGVFGLVVGGIIVAVLHLIPRKAAAH
ncbi:DUF808 domain-containing protein [Sphingoaurantiacus capsulatus]|uniref:DUF808 domain-containing protein n=1 Tax=Sphingoaurantiacus capsulatus TaxID=1771310 RepID=A0ABV7XA90_9SPHN